jgi:predicted CXXCH cytochrome family protein
MSLRGVLLVLAAAASARAVGSAAYVGAAACAKCHAEIHRKWSGSRHSKMVQPATPTSVKGDFTRGKLQLRGAPYALREKDGVYYITESTISGKPQEHRVDYTLGNRRIQHYLTTMPTGRVIVLAPSWDILRKQWFHNFDIADPDETDEVVVQVWNKNCFSCHVSRQDKGFDAARNEYRTTWQDFGTNCERCHGPGGAHVEHYSATPPPAGPARDIVLQTRLDAERNTMVCAQCHSFRDIYVAGFAAGENYYDYFLPILEATQPADRDPAYWPDGRTRRFSNDAFGLWQSECYLKGKASCTGCHTAAHETEIERNPQLRPDANALCTRCHESIGKALGAHTHHTEAGAGSSCVECHMPRTVLSIKAQIRDHSMSVPAPENTLHHGIPNACNLCHKNRDARWSLEKMSVWYGTASRQKWIRRADAFASAAKGDVRAIPGLIAILNEPRDGPLARANAVSYLPRFAADPRVFPALSAALEDGEPLVRAVAALRMTSGPADKAAAVRSLTKALEDAAATVRIGAAVSLVSLGIKELPGEEGARFESAKSLYRARAELNIDDAEQQMGAGRFYLLTGDPVRALTALQTSLRLDPQVPARYLLAAAYVQQGEVAKARETLLTIPARDADYAKAQRLLRAIDAQGGVPH